MIIPARIDLTVRRNDNPFNLHVNVTEDDLPLNLAGYAMRMEVRSYKGAAGSALLTASTGNPATTPRIIAGNGYWELIIPRSDIRALPVAARLGDPRTFYYDILVRDLQTNENAWYEGRFDVDPGVTQ